MLMLLFLLSNKKVNECFIFVMGNDYKNKLYLYVVDK